MTPQEWNDGVDAMGPELDSFSHQASFMDKDDADIVQRFIAKAQKQLERVRMIGEDYLDMEPQPAAGGGNQPQRAPQQPDQGGERNTPPVAPGRAIPRRREPR